jgi:urease subunit gamma/beta
VQLTPSETDRLLLFLAAELARARRARGLRLNAPEATALVADTVAEAARDGARLADAITAGRSVLGPDDLLPGVAAIVGEVLVEAVFDDGTRLAVVTEPFGTDPRASGRLATGDRMPGEVSVAAPEYEPTYDDVVRTLVRNTGEVPVSVTSHFHFFEVNPRLRFDRSAGYGRHLALAAGAAQRFDPGVDVEVELVPIGGARVAIGFAGLVDGPLDAPGAFEAAMVRLREQGFEDAREAR